MSTFGEVNWTDNLDFGDSKDKKSGNKDLFLRLTEGDNEVRFVTSPHQYLVHKVKRDANNPKDFGQKVMCSAISGTCPACVHGEAKPRWLVGVIDRKSGAYKILDMGWQVFQQIRTHAKNAKLGDPQKYDINIFVNPKGGPSGYYTVQTYSKEALSAEDQNIKDTADLEDLKRRVQPPAPEKVQERLNKIFGDAAPAPQAAAKPAGKTAAKATPTVAMTDDEELGKAFPAYVEDTQ